MTTVPWHIVGGRVLSPSPFALMGIVNVTPDSFYDGGVHTSTPDSSASPLPSPSRADASALHDLSHADTSAPHDPRAHDLSQAHADLPPPTNGSHKALLHAFRLLDEGACIVDVGGESSRPNADPVSAEAEWARIEPLITGIVAHRPDACISVDTTKAYVAQKALLAGAHCINDVSACLDPALLELVGAVKPGYVLMHNTGRADNLLQLLPDETLEYRLLSFFETQMSRLIAAGLPLSHIMLDPGIGFGTNPELALQMLRILPSLKQLGRPILAGISMKSFIGHFFDAPVQERGPWTCMITALLARQGIVWHRVHDVGACAKALEFTRGMCAEL